jgi:hypothetical protein
LHPAPPPAASEGIAKAEELPENIAEVLKHCGIEAPTAACIANSSVAIAVIKRPLLGVGQDRVSLSDFLETFFRIRIVRIPVRMVLHRKFTISALQLLIAYRAAHCQHFVVIAFCVRGQKRLPFRITKLMIMRSGDDKRNSNHAELRPGVLRHLHHRRP